MSRLELATKKQKNVEGDGEITSSMGGDTGKVTNSRWNATIKFAARRKTGKKYQNGGVDAIGCSGSALAVVVDDKDRRAHKYSPNRHDRMTIKASSTSRNSSMTSMSPLQS